jgi:hypothetical protein
MNNRLNALCLSGALALSFLMTKPAVADDWNKRTEFQFGAPVEIPGRVLTPGEYVFELEDNQTDRNIVKVFSEDSSGKERLVATLFVIPDYVLNTPDKPIIHFEERHSGTPDMIHSWFYQGDNTGWAFVYPKEQSFEASAKMMPAPALAAIPAAPSLPPAPQIQEARPGMEVATVEEEVLFAQNGVPAPPPTQESGTQNSADRVLPETAGYSGLELIAGLAMLSAGITAVFFGRSKSHAQTGA